MNNKNNSKKRKIVNIMSIAIALIILTTIFTSFVLADAPMYDFQQFFGEVKGAYNGETITVKYGEKVLATSIVEQDKYGYKQLLKVNAAGLKKGDKIKFFIKNKEIVEIEFEPEQPTKLDLVLIPEPFCGDKKCLGQETCSSCATDCGECPEDKDNDGVYDYQDRFIAPKEKFVEKLKNFKKEKVKIKVDNKEELKAEYSGKKEIKIEEENKQLLKFEVDFDKKKFDLEKVIIEKQLPAESQGYTVVKGLSAQDAATTKTVYLDHLKQEIKSVCVKDAEVANINEISTACNGTSEVFLVCNGTIIEGYKCIDLGNQFEVSGLKNSAVREQQAAQTTPPSTTPQPDPNAGKRNLYACEDGKDNDKDGFIDLKDPGCSNSNDNDEYDACKENWGCGDWSECKDGVYTRTCGDVNVCGTIKNRPNIKVACSLGTPRNDNPVEQKAAEQSRSATIPKTTINSKEPSALQSSQKDASLQQPSEIKQQQEAKQQTPAIQEAVKQETASQQLQSSSKKKPISKTILLSLAIILGAVGSMLVSMFYNKPGPMPAPPVIAKIEKKIEIKAIKERKELQGIKEDDELFEV